MTGFFRMGAEYKQSEEPDEFQKSSQNGEGVEVEGEVSPEEYIDQRVNDLASQIRQALQELPDVHKDADTVRALQEIKDELQKVRRSFVSRLAEVAELITRPNETLTRWKEEKQRQQFETPDHPKVLQRFFELLGRDSRKDIYEKDGHILPSFLARLAEIKMLFEQAKREDSKKWEVKDKIYTHLLDSLFLQCVRNSDVEEAWKVWERTPQTLRGKYAEEMIALERSLLPPSQLHFATGLTIVEVFAKEKQFFEEFQPLEQKFASDPILSAELKKVITHKRNNIFQSRDRFILEQPRQVIERVMHYTQENRYNVSEEQFLVLWENNEIFQKVLDYPQWEELIDIFFHCRQGGFYVGLKDCVQSSLSLLEKFSAEQIHTLIEKGLPLTALIPDAKMEARIQMYLLPEVTKEQIQAVKQNQDLFDIITLVYGKEGIQKLWTPDHIKHIKENGWNYKVDPSLLEFVQTLTPSMRKHLPSLKDEANFLSCLWPLKFLQKISEIVPSSYLEEFFSHVTPSFSQSELYLVQNEFSSPLNEEELHHIFEFHDIFPHVSFTLQKIQEKRKYFSTEVWARIQKGITTYQESDLLKILGDPYQGIDILEKAGTEGNEKANQTLLVFTKNSENVVLNSNNRYGYESSSFIKKREIKGIRSLYAFFENLPTFFSQDTELQIQCFQLSPQHAKIVEAALKNFPALLEQKNYLDLPVIEGMCQAIGELFVYKEKNVELEQFTALPGEQKKLFLWLRDQFHYRSNDISPLLENGKAQKMFEFQSQCNVKIGSGDLLALLCERPDCLGVFYYILDEGGYYNAEKTPHLVEKLIALYDQGLPPQFFLSSPGGRKKSLTHSSYEQSLSKFLEWESKKLAAICQRAAEKGLDEFSLSDILLYADNTEEEEILFRRIDLASCDLSLSAVFSSRSEESPTNEYTQRTQERFEVLRQYDYTKGMKYHFMEDVSRIDEETWNELFQKPKMLKQYFESNSIWDHFPWWALSLSDEITDNKFFWSGYSLHFLSKSPEKAKDCFALLQKFEDMGYTMESQTSLEKVLTFYSEYPSFFEKEILTNFGVNEIPRLAQFSPEELKKRIAFAQHFHSGGSLLSEYEKLDSQDRDALIELFQGIKSKISWWDHREILKVLQENKHDIEKTKEILDKGEKLNGSATDWQAARVLTFLPPEITTLVPEALPSLLKNTNYDKAFSLDDILRLGSLSEEALLRLESLFSPEKKIVHPDLNENLFLIVEHPNFPLISKGFKNGDYLYYLFNKYPLEKTKFILDTLTPALFEDINNLPEYIKVNLYDAVNILHDTSLKDELLTLANDLRSVFGTHIKFELADLFFLNASTNVEHLKILKDRCFLHFDGDMLKKVNPLLKGEEKMMAESILSTLDSKNTIDVSLALKALEKVPASYRFETIQGKITSLGWGIIHPQNRLLELGLTEEQIYELAKKLYFWEGPEFTSLNASLGKRLLQEKVSSYESGKTDQLMFALLNRGEEGFEYYFDLFLSEYKTVFLERLFVLVQNKYLSEKLKNSLPLWEVVYTENFTLFTQSFDSVPDVFFTPEKIQNIYQMIVDAKSKNSVSSVKNFFTLLREKGIQLAPSETTALIDLYIAGSGSLSFLRPEEKMYMDPALLEKKELFQERINYVIQNWHEDIEKALTFLEVLRSQNQISPDFFNSISDIFIHTRGESYKENTALTSKIERVFVEAIVFLEPTIKKTFFDPEKLGKLREKVFEQITALFQKFHEEKTDYDTIIKLLRQRLKSIKQVFESSDSSESDRRLIFVDLFDLSSCGCPVVAEQKNKREEMVTRVQTDLHEILMASGSAREIKATRRKRDVAPVGSPERENLEKEIEQALEIQKKADERNRVLAQQHIDHPELRAEIFLKEKTLTHGAPLAVLDLILEDGNFTGELLGSQSKRDYSGALGVDVSQVQETEGKNFQKRYASLKNSTYGNVLLLFGDYHSSERPAYFSGVIGSDHHLVRTGLASSEITGMVVRSESTDSFSLKKIIAKKGGYIPLLDTTGNILFSPEEFDELKGFYYTLTEKGYSLAVIDHVYNFYKQNKDLETKTAVVLNKAVELLQKGELHEDIAVLVDFLKTNELNAHGVDWYQEAEFDVIMNSIKRSIRRRKSGNTRTILFEGGRLAPESEVPLARKSNVFLDTFFEMQLPFTQEGQDAEISNQQKKKFERSVAELLYKTKNYGGTIETAKLFSEQKRELVRRLWTEAWKRIEARTENGKETLERMKSKIIPAVTGSVGRGEVVLSSDLDYLLYVDDETEPLSPEEITRIQSFVNTDLSQEMNLLLSEKGIRADAGLAKQDRVPFTLLSHLRTFTIDLTADRQKEEPTEILDSEALFEEGNYSIERAKDNIFSTNLNSELMESFIERDLFYDKEHFQSYAKSFEDLYESVAKGDLLNKVKESLQRVLAFKQYHLLFRGVNNGSIPRAEVKSIPSSLTERVSFLQTYGLLTPQEAKTYRELYAITYKLRFVGEIFSSEAQQKTSDKIAAKVKNVQYKVENFSYEERVNLIRLLKEFKTDILYK